MTTSCLCGHPHADHQQTRDGAAECDLCDCFRFTRRFEFAFPDQTCPHCRAEHPGETCHLQNLSQPLPI